MFDSLKTEGKIFKLSTGTTTILGLAGKKIFQIPFFISEGRTIEELRCLQKIAMRSFYFRPIVILRFIKLIGSAGDIAKYFKGGLVL